ALIMKPLGTQKDMQVPNHLFSLDLPHVEDPIPVTTVKGSQFRQPLFEFSGACAGCGETPYIKVVTQLFGDRMLVANATGCSSIYGGSAPSCPYTVNHDGHGPAWANSLFEDNAEYGFGMELAVSQRRAKLADFVRQAMEVEKKGELYGALKEWLENMDDGDKSKKIGRDIVRLIEAKFYDSKGEVPACFLEILDMRDYLTKKSIWIIGGDGWAYDIGY
ncbi:pyruvate:ferredoxin (flavodoxin) oxidoreductase, partial [bacterium]|nr:pyruvate:ferredoxin (flavodoxin) oxidoreductase [bacterium]